MCPAMTSLASPVVELTRGFVFGSLNPNVAPVAEWLGPAWPVFDWLVDRFPHIRMSQEIHLGVQRELETAER